LIRGAPNRPNLGNAMFLQIDANGDGIVTRDEVKAKYSKNPTASTTIFDRLDTDKNDMLSKEEFSKLAEVLGR
jgi:Ca2+-binding EF-hand superfamily protein